MRIHDLKSVLCSEMTRPTLHRVGDNRDPVLRIDDPSARTPRGLCIRANGRVAPVALSACCDASWDELKNDELLSIYNAVLKHNRLVEDSLTYQNHCWNCKSDVDGARDYRCTSCSWYACHGCGECGCNYRGPVERDPRRRREVQDLKDDRQRCIRVLKVLKLQMREREISFGTPATSVPRLPR